MTYVYSSYVSADLMKPAKLPTLRQFVIEHDLHVFLSGKGAKQMVARYHKGVSQKFRKQIKDYLDGIDAITDMEPISFAIYTGDG